METHHLKKAEQTKKWNHPEPVITYDHISGTRQFSYSNSKNSVPYFTASHLIEMLVIAVMVTVLFLITF